MSAHRLPQAHAGQNMSDQNFCSDKVLIGHVPHARALSTQPPAVSLPLTTPAHHAHAPGEIIYIPAATIMTSLSIHDSLSYRQSIALSAEAVTDRVNSNIWAPESGVIPAGYQFGACFDGLNLGAAGAALSANVNPMQGQIIQQIMAQYYAGDKARNMLMLNILAECAAVLSAPGLDADQTYCKKAWPQCVKQLAKNAQTSGVAVPKWLGDDMPGKGWGGGKSEL